MSRPPLSGIRHASAVPTLLREAGREVLTLVVQVGAYAGVVALLLYTALHVLSGLKDIEDESSRAAAADNDGWVMAARPQPALALPLADLTGKAETYETARHPDGGRRDIVRWSAEDGTPVASVMLLRPGHGAVASAGETVAEWDDIAASLPARSGPAIPDGTVPTKFGPVGLVGFSQAGAFPRCHGFAIDFEAPALRIAGYLCGAGDAAASRARLACAIDRLTLLSAGSDSDLAALFARADLDARRDCRATPAQDWLASAAEPSLRGRL